MWGGKPITILLILSMLSACAGTHTPAAEGVDLGSERAVAASHDAAIETNVAGLTDRDRLLLERSEALASARTAHAREPHYHDEPGPREQYIAEVALLITAQIFVCSFVVVVLDGHCDLYASTGYSYYY